jgi:hypothetical protein
MGSWGDVLESAGELGRFVQRRIEDHGLALLATLKRDGSPRISGIEPFFARDELWLGMMPDSRKSLDLRRDARFSLHNATIDKEVRDGDVKISGRAVEVLAEATKEEFRRAFEEANGAPIPAGPFDLYTADVHELVSILPGGDHLVVESWSEGRGLSRVERR